MMVYNVNTFYSSISWEDANSLCQNKGQKLMDHPESVDLANFANFAKNSIRQTGTHNLGDITFLGVSKSSHVSTF